MSDLQADLDRCKRSLLSAVTERDEARAEIVRRRVRESHYVQIVATRDVEIERLNQQIVDRDTTIMLAGETIERLRTALSEIALSCNCGAS